MKAILLAGGSGSRFWPISSDSLPKQFLRIGKDKSFFQQTIQRLLKVLLPKDIVVVTNAKFQSKVLSDLYELGISVPPCNVVLEPVGKNTAPAIALGIKYCMDKLNRDEEEVVLVTPSDHVIEPQERFIEYLSYAEQLAKQDCIVAFGVKPTRAETGYGYIKVSHSHEINNFVYFDVDRFVEKPNLETAERFLAEGKYYWNSGIFVFKIRTIVEEFKKHAPDIAIALNSNFESMLKNFSNMVSISIDYAVMEKTKNVKMIPLDIYWNDVGCWDSIYELFEKDKDGNVTMENVLTFDTKNCLIMGNKKLIVALGVEDVFVVETEHAILISKRGKTQNVAQIVSKLKKECQ